MSVLLQFIRHSCHRASIGKNPRPLFSRLYPVVLVRPDGSTIRISYREPISIMKLPFDLSTVDEYERKKRLLKRQMGAKKVVTKSEDDEINFDDKTKFDHRKYINLKK
jgi:large subunit ribosomal protein L55